MKRSIRMTAFARKRDAYSKDEQRMRSPITRKRYAYRKFKRYGSSKKGSLTGFPSRNKKPKGFKKTVSKVLGITLGLIIFATIIGTLFAAASLANISASLPNPHELVDRESALSTKIYDRGGPENGTLLYTIYGEQNREFISIDKLPDHTKWAFLAAEDAEFYDHKGLDLPGLAKAGFNYFVHHQTNRGASTISQQLVRNTLLFDILQEEAYEKTLTRKIKEMLITMQLEQTFSKDEILQMYLNEVPLGGTNYGIQAASKAYFNKDASLLTLEESALLAGLIQSPGVYSPLFGTNPELAKERQTYVLSQMYDKRNIINRTAERQGSDFRVTEDLIDEAKEKEIVYAPGRIDILAPHFVFYVKQQLIDEYGIDRVERGGLIVTTTLDYDLQQIAQEEVVAGVDSFRTAYNINNGSMIVMDPKTGQVLAMVGSYDYWAAPDPRVDGNVNIATALRQMGSSVKPYTYLTAFSKGYSPGMLTPDIPLDFGPAYKPENWDGKYYGLILARQALVESRNIPALYTLKTAGGVPEFIKTAEAFGITTLTTPDQYGLSITLGAAEMKLIEHTAAYGTFANSGLKNPTTSVLKVETRKGDILQEWEPGQGKQVWDEKEIYLLNWVLCDLGNQGRIFPNRYMVGTTHICGKTGTTDGPRDLTAFLYNPNLVVGVWTGNNNNDVTIGTSGQGWSTTVPLPIAHSFFSRVIGKYGLDIYTRPAGIISGAVCSDTGLLATETTPCTKSSTVFIQGRQPALDKGHEQRPICIETGKIATNETQAAALGLIEYKVYLEIKTPDPQFQKSLDSWLTGHPQYGVASSVPESAECPLHLGPDNAPVITLTSPASGAIVKQGNSISLSATTKSLAEIKSVEYYLDSVSIGKVKNAPYSVTYTIPLSTTPGSHAISATVTDTDGKSGSTSSTITVTSSPGAVLITSFSPSDGATLSNPQLFTAVLSGNTEAVTSVTFYLIAKTGDEERSIEATKVNSSTWTKLQMISAPAGGYWFYAEATTGGETYRSTQVSVTIP